MKDLKCPVCGKNAIPDFHEEDVVCPCCGSDLSIYHKLSDLSVINRGKSVRNKSCKYLTFFAGILIFVFITGCIFLYIQRSQINDLSKDVQITREQNSLLKDSIIYLNERIAEQSIPHKTPQKRAHIYVVKKGDSFCRIRASTRFWCSRPTAPIARSRWRLWRRASTFCAKSRWR